MHGSQLLRVVSCTEYLFVENADIKLNDHNT